MEGSGETPNTSTVEVPTPAALDVAVGTAAVAADVATGAADRAADAANAATDIAVNLNNQIEDDEEWLENQLKEIRTEIQNLRVEATAIPQSLMVTLSQQAELIQKLTDQITALSNQATLFLAPKTTETPAAQAETAAPKEGEGVPEVPATPKANEKKRRKI